MPCLHLRHERGGDCKEDWEREGDTGIQSFAEERPRRNGAEKEQVQGACLPAECPEEGKALLHPVVQCMGFDPKTAEKELAAHDTSSPSLICTAAMKDFPFAFKKRGPDIDLDEWEKEITTLNAKPSYSIDWDETCHRYVGSIKGIDSLTITSTYPSVVTMGLVRVSWLLMAIELLRDIGKS